jgi:hypothetical protein
MPAVAAAAGIGRAHIERLLTRRRVSADGKDRIQSFLVIFRS